MSERCGNTVHTNPDYLPPDGRRCQLERGHRGYCLFAESNFKEQLAEAERRLEELATVVLSFLDDTYSESELDDDSNPPQTELYNLAMAVRLDSSQGKESCDHDWIYAPNVVMELGEICSVCGAVRASQGKGERDG